MATGPDLSDSCDAGYVSSVESNGLSIAKELGQLSITVGVPMPGEVSGLIFEQAPGGPSVTDGSRQQQANEQAGEMDTRSNCTPTTGTADIQETAEGRQTAHMDQSSRASVSSPGDLSIDAAPEEPPRACGNEPPAMVPVKPEERDSTGEVVPGGSHPPVDAQDKMPQAQPARKQDVDDDIPDEDVPTELMLPQIDFIMLAAKLDQEEAYTFMNDVLLCCKEGEVAIDGVLHDEQYVEVGGGLRSIHPFEMGTVSHNYQRATYVLAYITEALFEQRDARNFLYGAIHHLVTNEDRRNSVLPLWVCSKKKIETFARRSPDKKALAGLLLPFNGVACDKKRDIEKLKLVLKGDPVKKEKRCKAQQRQIKDWKRQERMRREEEKQQQEKEQASSSPAVSCHQLSYEEPAPQLLGGVLDRTMIDQKGCYTKPVFSNTEGITMEQYTKTMMMKDQKDCIYPKPFSGDTGGITMEQYAKAMKNCKLDLTSQSAASNMGSTSLSAIPTPQGGKNPQTVVFQTNVNIQVPSVPASDFFEPGVLENDSTSASELEPDS